MATQIIVPILGESISEATLVEWLKGVGDEVKRGEEIALLETAKATLQIECPRDGVLLHIAVDKDSDVHIGQVLAIIGSPGEPFDETLFEEQETQQVGSNIVEEARPEKRAVSLEKSNERVERVRISPVARRRADELGFEIAELNAFVGDRRILLEDIDRYSHEIGKSRTSLKPESDKSADLDSSSGISSSAQGRRIELTEIKKISGQRMTRSAFSAPQFSVAIEVNMDSFESARNGLNAEKSNPLEMTSVTALLIHIVSKTLQKHPYLNAKYDNGAIWVFDNVNMAIGMATQTGLIAPIIAGVEHLALGDLTVRLNTMIIDARDGRPPVSDNVEGTITISNLGMLGITTFTPIINPPQAAILGVGSIRPVVVPDDAGTAQCTYSMSITVTADHRVVDGSEIASFLNELRRMIEEFKFQD